VNKMTDLEIVQEAQKVIEERIKNYESFLSSYKEKLGAGYEWTITNLNSWLAHKAFFERHKPHDGYNGVVCLNCYRYNASYPCPELVAQAKAILGVE